MAVAMTLSCSGTSSPTASDGNAVISARDSTLSSLGTTPGQFAESFRRDLRSYQDSVPAGTSAVTVHAVPNVPADVKAITFNGAADSVVALSASGNTVITVLVENLNGSRNAYTVEVVRRAPAVVATAHDSTLSSLGLSGGGKLFPSFSRSILDYLDTVPHDTASVTVGVIAGDATDSLAYAVDAGAFSVRPLVDLVSGKVVTVSVKVINRNGNSLVYRVGVFRKPADTAVPVPWQTGIAYGSVTDAAGQAYRTVQVGSRWWMAENLSYAGAGGKTGVCYGNSADSCARYGRLYTWEEAMAGAASSDSAVGTAQGICPIGWHVPTDEEWNSLQQAVDSTEALSGARLKSLAGWSRLDSVSGNGLDTYGFRALPGGYESGTVSVYSGNGGLWWSATQLDTATSWYRSISYTSPKVGRTATSKATGFSVRCAKD